MPFTKPTINKTGLNKKKGSIFTETRKKYKFHVLISDR